MNYELFNWTEAISEEWDQFVIDHPYGSIHQISCWREFQKTIPGRGSVRGFGMRDAAGFIVATCFCVRMSTGIQDTYWYYSARGPVVDPKQDPLLVQTFIKKISQELKKNSKALFWRLDPYFTPEDFENIADEKLIWQKATQDYQPTNTLVLDLLKTNEELLSEMKRKGRYNIKIAEKNEITVRRVEATKATEKDIHIFWKLNQATTDRDNFSGHAEAYYQNFIKLLASHSVLFIAERNNIAFAAAINTHCGEKAIYYFGASTSNHEDRKLMAPYLLQWEMIQYAREQGCTSYDFLGIAPENDPQHPYAGISDFKWKFGGTRNIYDHGKEIVFRPWWYKIYRLAKKIKK